MHPKKLILHHGTRANPASIMERGLLAGGLDRTCDDPLSEKYVVNKERTLKRVLGEFGLTKEQIPEWIYRGELEYEAGEPIHIHFELCAENADGYADMGGEPAYCIRRNLMIWLAGISDRAQNEIKDKLKEINRQAKEKNGPIPYRVTVEVDWDDPRLEEDAKKRILRIIEFRGNLKNYPYPMEVRYFGDILPEKIISITPTEL